MRGAFFGVSLCLAVDQFEVIAVVDGVVICSIAYVRRLGTLNRPVYAVTVDAAIFQLAVRCRMTADSFCII